MPLSGEAKKAYMRSYMRKRRKRRIRRESCAWCGATNLILVGPATGPLICSACAGEAHREATRRAYFREKLPRGEP